MLQTLRTAILHVPDIAAAKAWYAKATRIAPYFDAPFHVGFDLVGGGIRVASVRDSFGNVIGIIEIPGGGGTSPVDGASHA